MKRILHLSGFLCLLLCLCTHVSAQQKYTLSGFLKDAENGETLIGANVYINEIKTGTVSNNFGFYSITLEPGTYSVFYSYVGYEPKSKQIVLDKDIELNVNLGTGLELNEVVITEEKIKIRENVERPQMGVIDIPIKQIKELPVFLGEQDILKSIQLLPGVQSGSEATAAYYVRGGGADQNLVILDDAVVYNPFHAAGFMSIFNMDAIKNLSLYKGGFPAQYGGRLSSILDISLKDGNNQKFEAEGGIGQITSRLTLQGPIQKGKSSFMISGRAFYYFSLIRAMVPKSIRQSMPNYYFYDLNPKLNFQLSKKDRLFISGYYGDDVINFKNTSDTDTTEYSFPWGNKTATLRWNHLFNQKLFSNTSLIYSDYDFTFRFREGDYQFKLVNGIRDLTAKIDFDYFPSVLHKVKFGLSYTHHKFTPVTDVEAIELDTLISENTRVYEVDEFAAYINDEYTVNDQLALNLGLRFPMFLNDDQQYFGIEPRLTAKYTLDENTSVKAGYTLMNQYIHLLSSSTVSVTPLDLWLPSSKVIKPQNSHQVALGLFKNFKEDMYEGNVEVYYKTMGNQIEYEEGESLFGTDSEIDSILTFGKGWSYGAEFFLRKRSGRFNGFIAYTLATSQRRFGELNNGNIYPAKYDRRHDLSVAVNYDFNSKWSFSALFVFGSGHNLTLPVGRFYVPYNGWGSQYSYYYDYVEKNGYQMKAFNRMDVGIKYKVDRKKRTGEWRFDIYNVYSRRNPYFVYLGIDRDRDSNASKYYAFQVSILPMIPSVSYNFKF